MNRMEVEYPARDSHFAHKFTRLLMKSCAAQELGPQSCLLLTYIVHTEDAARYSGPVRFWNSQLMQVMGFRSPKQLNEARQKAVDAGWLVYFRPGNREVGCYFVSVPAFAEGFTDGVIEQNHSVNHSDSGTNSGTNTKRIAERIGDGSRNESVTESGKPSIPIPIPIPVPNPNPNFSSEPDKPPAEPAILTFPCSGKKGGDEYNLTQTKLDEYADSYPGVDVLAECRKALQWCRDNPTKRKTRRGTPAFISRWLAKVQDSGNAKTNGNGTPLAWPAVQRAITAVGREKGYRDRLAERIGRKAVDVLAGISFHRIWHADSFEQKRIEKEFLEAMR